MKLVKKTNEPASISSGDLQPDKKSALILVHLQNDFFPGGALPTPEGEGILPQINQYIGYFQHHAAAVMATRDWHPPNHSSFKEQGGPWPPHCIQGSRGAQFHADLHLPNGSLIISVATNPQQDSLSGFDGTSLADYLEDRDTKAIFVVGLTTESRIKQTVLDGIKLGLRVVVLEDGIRGVGQNANEALHKMSAAGAIRATAKDFGL